MEIVNIKIVFGVFIFTTAVYAQEKIEKSSPKSENIRNITDTQHVIAEGGVTASLASTREGYVENSTKVPLNIPVSNSKIESVSTNSSSIKSTVTENTHRTLPRKGVPKETNVTAEVTIKPKKPTVTVPGNNESDVTSHTQSDKLNSTSKTPKVPNNNILNSNQDNTQKYIVPIVIVILSVPFVAILISVVYKRGAEWWKYRHYRRMDFLINGIYDN
ncbi:hypothetical protein RI129_007960 [Pyrocoelia pectoralis]|uniref:Uncharacterized protein n=1 Tax=Pyrocoelia pectoralis TaxID=417401 RepID=A0AAN7V9B6_9COLE